MKFAYAQRSYLGDPEFVCPHFTRLFSVCLRLPPKVANMTTTLDRILSKDFAYLVRRNISSTMTFPSEYYGGEYEVQPTPGTTHISVLDKNGNVASVTSTVNLAWGSRLMTRNGIVMNNQMDDFSSPNTTNAFNLRASPANYIGIRSWLNSKSLTFGYLVAPFKRPLSSSVPCAVLQDDRVLVVAGASGGSRIITGTLNVRTLSAGESGRINHYVNRSC